MICHQVSVIHYVWCYLNSKDFFFLMYFIMTSRSFLFHLPHSLNPSSSIWLNFSRKYFVLSHCHPVRLLDTVASYLLDTPKIPFRASSSKVVNGSLASHRGLSYSQDGYPYLEIPLIESIQGEQELEEGCSDRP